MGRIVLLESSDIGARYTAEAVKSLGHEPLFLCHLADYQADPRARIEAYPHIECRTTSVDPVLHALDRLDPKDIVAITTFCDTRLKTAHEAAGRLGVLGLDSAIVDLKNKGTVAKLTPEFSPPGAIFPADQVPEEEIRALLKSFSKVIVKPAEGAGAMGVFTVRSPDEVATISDRIRRKQIPAHHQGGGWIAQAFVEGELASLEGYVINGMVRTLGFTSRKKVGATESAASFPIDSILTDIQRECATDAVRVLIERSGFRNGYFHVEFIFNPAGVFLIDANMGRLGGGPVGELLSLSYGISPVSVYEHVLEVSLFGRESHNPYEHAIRRESTLAVLYGLEGGGELHSVNFPANTSCFHTQILGPGAKVTPMGTDDWSWIGIVTGLTSDTQNVVERLKIQTSDGIYPPCF